MTNVSVPDCAAACMRRPCSGFSYLGDPASGQCVLKYSAEGCEIADPVTVSDFPPSGVFNSSTWQYYMRLTEQNGMSLNLGDGEVGTEYTTGGTCFGDENCEDATCVNGACSAGNENDECDQDSDCQSYACVSAARRAPQSMLRAIPCAGARGSMLPPAPYTPLRAVVFRAHTKWGGVMPRYGGVHGALTRLDPGVRPQNDGKCSNNDKYCGTISTSSSDTGCSDGSCDRKTANGIGDGGYSICTCCQGAPDLVAQGCGDCNPPLDERCTNALFPYFQNTSSGPVCYGSDHYQGETSCFSWCCTDDRCVRGS